MRGKMCKIDSKSPKQQTTRRLRFLPQAAHRFMHLFWLFVLYYVWHSTLFTLIFYKQIGNNDPYNEQNEP